MMLKSKKRTAFSFEDISKEGHHVSTVKKNIDLV